MHFVVNTSLIFNRLTLSKCSDDELRFRFSKGFRKFLPVIVCDVVGFVGSDVVLTSSLRHEKQESYTPLKHEKKIQNLTTCSAKTKKKQFEIFDFFTLTVLLFDFFLTFFKYLHSCK